MSTVSPGSARAPAWDTLRPVELPRRDAAPPRANDTGPEAPTERTVAAAPQSVGGRFDRGLRRLTREQTSLLSWLAESDQAESLRTADVDLRDDVVIDARHDDAEPVEPGPDVVNGRAEVPSGSLFQR